MIPLKKISLLWVGFIAFSFFYSCNTDTIDALEKRITELENSTPDTVFITSTDTLYISNLDTLYLFDTVYLVSDSIFVGNITLSGQKQLDEFGSYGFKKIIGDLKIVPLGSSASFGDFGYDVNDLSSLTTIQEVLGYLRIQTLGNNLTGLNNLVKATSALIIYGPNITSLTGLESLKEVGVFHIQAGGISNLDDLTSLSVVSGDFSLNGSGGTIESVDALAGVKFTGLSFRITSCPNLTSLAAIDGLEGVKEINLWGLPALTELPSTSGQVLELKQLTIDRTAVTSLTGLEGVVSLESGEIANNSNLESVDGLENLANLIRGISIYNNSNLSDYCSIKSLWEANPSSIYISENAFNPQSADEIIGCN